MLTPSEEPTERTVSVAADGQRGDDGPLAALGETARLGRYALLDLLGQGGMGMVFSAYDPELDRKVAIKLLRHVGVDPRSRAVLLAEAQALARLAHPNVIHVYEVGETRERVFIAMEFVRGQTLRQWLRQPRPWPEVVAMFLQAGRGLAAAHQAGVLHCDFKPESGLASQMPENTSVSRLRRGCVPTMYQAGGPRQDRAARDRRRQHARSRTCVTEIGARWKESTNHERLDHIGVL